MSAAPSDMEAVAACLRGEVPANADWLAIVRTANDHLVTPSLYRRLVDCGQGGGVDDDALAYLKSVDDANRDRNERLLGQVLEAARALNAAGIEPLLIKGAADLLASDDPRGSARIMADIDLLVAEEELAAAETALGSLGYAAREGTRTAHSRADFARRGRIATIDLHHRLPGAAGERVCRREIAERTLPVARDGAVVRIPDPSLALFINLAHDMIHDRSLFEGAIELRYLWAVAETLTRHGDALDWAWIDGKRSLPKFALALDLQLTMVKELFGVTGSSPVELGSVASLLHRRLVVRMRNPLLARLERAVLRRADKISYFGALKQRLISRP